jgi:hypothetical protein
MSLIDQPHAEISPADTRRDLVTLSRITGTSGVGTLVVVLGSSLLNGYQNQPFTESPAKIIPFFRSIDDRVGWASSWGTSVGLIALLFFMVGLAMILRQHERGLPWRTTFLAAAGVVSVVSGQIASWDAAAYRSSTIDPQVATYAFDLGNISFVNGWSATGAIAILAGLVMLRSRELPRWVAWWGIVAGVGQLIARGFFRDSVAFAPFGLFWTWTLAISVLLLLGRFVPRKET